MPRYTDLLLPNVHGNEDQEHQSNPNCEGDESRLPVTIEARSMEMQEVVVVIVVVLLATSFISNVHDGELSFLLITFIQR